MQLKFLNTFKKKFGLKIFSIFAFFTLVISLSFTLFFYQQQSKALADELIDNNLLLAGVLAYNARIGVFAESEELLRNPVDGIFQQKETVEVSIYDLQGRLLTRRTRSDREEGIPQQAVQRAQWIDTGIFNKLKTSAAPFHRERRNSMEFWSPVVASPGHLSAEYLLVDQEPLQGKKRLIGFVGITVGKAALNKKLATLLMKSVLIGLLFLAIGSGIIYFTVKRIVGPLQTLIKGVQALEKGALGEKVPVNTEDEIGQVALAFNQMSESLLVREVEKKELEARLRHSQKMEAIGTLAGGIAHDFNNVLGIIMGNAEMAMLTTPGQVEIQRCFREIFKASIRAKDLVKQILTFSRQDSQERNPLLIKPIVEETLIMMRASLPSTIEIRRNFQRNLAPILSDPTQIHQVLMNLCTNAGHAMQDSGGILEVRLNEVEIAPGDPDLPGEMQPGPYQVLTVSDTGYGMDAGVKERIFDPFFTTKGPGKGTGMGLAVVHGIMKAHGGKITCQSEPGKGTTFEAYFPTTEDEASLSPEGVDSLPLGRERILFVDDEAGLASVGKQLLESLGYSVVAETGSINALEAFRARPDQFDLLITDNTMPQMTGLELIKNIREIRPTLPAILCTGYTEGISEEKVKALGIEEFLMKPLIRENIADVIRRALA